MKGLTSIILIALVFVKQGSQITAHKKRNCLELPSRHNFSVMRMVSRSDNRSDDGSFKPGFRVHYHCVHRVDGLRSKPDGHVVCRNGGWIGRMPQCKSSYEKEGVTIQLRPTIPPKIRLSKGKPAPLCETLPALFQGSSVYNRKPTAAGHYKEGTRVRFSCRIGHLVPKSASLVCRNGIWNGTFPDCRVSQCELPADVTGGAWSVIEHNGLLPIVQRGRILEAVRIEYVCQPGLSLVGSKWRDCLPTGLWSGHQGQCVPKERLYQRCSRPDRVAHGRIECRNCQRSDCPTCSRMTPFSVGIVLTVSCNEGYSMLSGEDSVQLRCFFPNSEHVERPRWNRRMPKCLPDDEIADIMAGPPYGGGGSLWSQDLTVVIAVSTVVMGGLLMIFTAVVACRCVRHAAGGRRGRTNSPLHHHHHPYTVSAASVAAGHRNEDCVALIVPPSYEEAVREGGPIGPNVSGGAAGPASTMPVDGTNPVSASHSRGGAVLPGSRLAHVLSRSPRIRSSGEGRDYRPLMAAAGQRQSRRATAAGVMSTGHHQHPPVHHHHHGNIPASAGEADSVSRHSTQTSGSHGPAYCLSGSLETMAVSDGTSVTLRTYESQHGGSNPSLISTRPQTGSLCEPQQSCPTSQPAQAPPGRVPEPVTCDVPVRATTQAPPPPPPATTGPNAIGSGPGYISPGSVIGSEKEDSISTRS